MMFHLPVLAGAVVLAFGAVFGENTLSVTQPPSLRDMFSFQNVQGAIEERPSLFGEPAYGRSMRGRLHLPPDNNLNGCSPMAFQENKDQLVFLLQRGNCTFTTKVRNAQDAGASAVIVVNYEDKVPTHMSIDGSDSATSAISIPSMIIKKTDGQKLTNHIQLNKDDPVQVSIEYGLSKTDIVNVDIWTSSMDPQSGGFADLGDLLAPLQEQGKLAVNLHYVFVDGTTYQCETGTQLCGNQCTNNGRYCAVDPDRDLSLGVSGADVVQENLRRICLSQYANEHKDYKLPWTYAKGFAEKCASDKKVNKECSKSVLESIKSGLYDSVQQCFDKSGGADPASSQVNSLIESEIKLKEESNVYLVPSFAFNKAPYYGTTTCRGPLSLDTCPLGKTLCNAYNENSIPNICRTSPGCSLGQVRDACNQCMDPASKDFISDKGNCVIRGGGVSVGTVIALIVVFVAILIGAAFVYHQHSAVKMRNELRSIMSQYVPLEGDGNSVVDSEQTRLV